MVQSKALRRRLLGAKARRIATVMPPGHSFGRYNGVTLLHSFAYIGSFIFAYSIGTNIKIFGDIDMDIKN
jgi:hypothetical protein